MRSAIFVEWLKLRRSRVTLTVTLLAVFVMPLLGFGFVRLAETGGNGAIGAKLEGLVVGTGWDAYFGVEGQMLAVSQFLAAGFLTVWCFGREFADRTIESLFALPVSRKAIAWAKFAALAGWATAICVAAVAAVGVVGFLAGLEQPSGGVLAGLAKLLAVELLVSILAMTAALAASIGRGYLPGFGAIIGLVAVSQVAVLFGSGGWFPYATPALWSVSWQDAAINLFPAQFALVVLTGLTGMWLTVKWWTRFEIT